MATVQTKDAHGVVIRAGDRLRMVKPVNRDMAERGDYPRVGHLGTASFVPGGYGLTITYDQPCPGVPGRYHWSGISHFGERGEDFEIVRQEVPAVSFKQNDIVRATKTHCEITPGLTGVVYKVEARNVWFRDANGRHHVMAPDGLVAVEGEWHPLTSYPGVPVEGESFVRPVRNLESEGMPRVTYLKHSVYPYKKSKYRDDSTHIALGSNPSDGKVSWHPVNFEILVEKGVPAVAATTQSGDPARAMAFATAIDFGQRLNRATGNQGLYRVRQRTWDKAGLYAAVERRSEGGVLLEKFYLATECEAELARIEASKTPIDVFFTKDGFSTGFFAIPGGTVTAPDGHRLWTHGEIRANKGAIVVRNGQKYRLCAKVRTQISGNPLVSAVDKTEVVAL